MKNSETRDRQLLTSLACLRSLSKEAKVLAVPFPFQVLLRDEAQGGGVEAVAQARGRRPVGEDVSEVRIGEPAPDLGARIGEAQVLLFDDMLGTRGFVKLGQPVPESNLSREEKSGSPETTST